MKHAHFKNIIYAIAALSLCCTSVHADTIDFGTFDGNLYQYGSVSASISAQTKLAGGDLKEGMFSVSLSDKDGKVVDTRTNDEKGVVSFELTGLEDPGTETYLVTENKSDDADITYDDAKYTATVTVEEGKDGNLKAVVSYDKTPVFSNVLKASEKSEAEISANVEVTGKELKSGEFTAQLLDQDGKVLQEKTNDKNGKFLFDAVAADKDGTYSYFLVQKDMGETGMTYDNTRIPVSVTVQDGKTKVEYPDENTFHNVYKADDQAVRADITAGVLLSGKSLSSQEFTIILKDSDGNIVQQKTNDASGSVAFDTLSFDKTGIYNYTLTEKNSGEDGIVYDTSSLPVVVTVKDNGKGNLTASVRYANGRVFRNVYASAKAEIGGRVSLEGRELKAGEFTLVLYDENRQELARKTNAADGTVSFEPVKYNKDGTYTYYVEELKGNEENITYDATSSKVTVNVVRATNGSIAASVKYEPDAVFKNVYTEQASIQVVIKAKAEVTGSEMRKGMFHFVLTDSDGNKLDTVANDDDGSASFGELTFSKEGTYTYTVSELKEEDEFMTYDNTVYTVMVNVKTGKSGKLIASVEGNNPTFHNAYNAENAGKKSDDGKKSDTKTITSHRTGDDTQYGVAGGLLIIGLGLFLWILFKHIREQ